MTRLTIGTRGSDLALWQARTVAAALRRTGHECELAVIRTTGDRLATADLSQVGGKQVFVKEIQQALLGGEIDLAVHSAKDMPAELPDGLRIAGVLPREDPRDAAVLPAGRPAPAGALAALAAAAGDTPRVGSGSVRRVAQLRRVWPRATFDLIRGNVGTRLGQLDGGAYDLLILAAAGLRRLGLADRISTAIDPDICLPAPGQGIVAMETRADDPETAAAVAAIDDPTTAAALEAERAVLTALGGGCQVPLGAYAEVRGRSVHLRALVASPDGGRLVRRTATGAVGAARALGDEVARGLLDDGAREILAAAGQPGPGNGG